ncbi:MAG TPA: radical SAM family heme chaperone HemW [Vicinamibacterales bacterium]|nr:radical SAM family heme chaperone HemW [Vicinamibacterales bacterium]
MLGLYLHIPFCASICSYCNFNRGLFDSALKTAYVRALEEEIRRAGDGSTADTIFFGGGTPSLLEPAEVARLIDACRDVFVVAPDAEVTLETNPETVTIDRMEGFRAAGVTRVSLGVQSLDDAELQRLGRTHTSTRARTAVSVIRSADFENVSLDLMMWLPQQGMADWQATVEGTIQLIPDHISLYLLELYPNAPLREAMARAAWSLAPDDDAAEMYLWAMARLDAEGYSQYEISNVTRPGRESRHNLKYWRDGAWLGFGCGAHSTRGAARWKNVASTTEYIDRVREGRDLQVDRRVRTELEQLEDALFTGLRLCDGVDLASVGRRYGVDVWARYGQALRPHIDAGRLLWSKGRLRLTRPGMLVANDVMTVFV